MARAHMKITEQQSDNLMNYLSNLMAR